MKVGEGGKTEEGVDNIGGQVNALLPVLPQDTGQGKKQRFYSQNITSTMVYIIHVILLYAKYHA